MSLGLGSSFFLYFVLGKSEVQGKFIKLADRSVKL